MNDVFPSAFRRFLDGFAAEYRRLRASAGSGQRAQHGQRGETDFMGHVPYVAGDDLRHLDWAAFGRSDRLFLKIFQAERSKGLMLMLDASASMGSDPAKRCFVLQLTALLGATALGLKIPLALRVAGAHQHFEERRDVQKLLTILAAQPLAEKQNYWRGRLAERAAEAKGRNLIVLSDCLEDLSPQETRQACQALAGQGRQVTLIATLGAAEADPAAGGIAGAMRLEDAESAATLDTLVDAQALRAYRHQLGEHFAGWAEAARQTGVGFAMIDGRRPVPEIAREILFPSEGALL